MTENSAAVGMTSWYMMYNDGEMRTFVNKTCRLSYITAAN